MEIVVTLSRQLDGNSGVLFSQMVMQTFGNEQILKVHKTAFLCSRRYPSSIVPKAYDWAIVQRETGNCVISGFHSQIEKDVFHYLLKGTQPIILVLARGLPRRISPEISRHISNNRLLVISPFSEKVTRITGATADGRNKLMIDLAEQIVIGHASDQGNLSALLKQTDNPVVFI